MDPLFEKYGVYEQKKEEDVFSQKEDLFSKYGAIPKKTTQKQSSSEQQAPLTLKDVWSMRNPVAKLTFGSTPGGKILEHATLNPVGDVLTGLTRAGENIPKGLAGLTDAVLGKFGKKTNFKNNIPTVDVNNVFGANKGSPLLQGAAQYAGGAVAGGSSLLGQIMGNAGFSAIQGAGEYKPGEENMMGILPEDEIGAAISGGLTGGALGALPFGIKPAIKAGKYLFGSSNPITQAKIPIMEQSIANKKITLEEAAEQHQKQMAAEQNAKSISEQETGKSKPSTMKYNLSEQERIAGEQSKQLEEFNKQLEQHENLPKSPENIELPPAPEKPKLPELPELPKINNKNHETNIKNAEQAIEKSNKNIEQAKLNYENSKQQFNQSESNVAEFLDSGAPHDEMIAERSKPELEKIFKEIPANYKSWIEDVKNRNVQISDIAMKKFFYSPKELGTLSDFAKSNNINILKPSGNEYLDHMLEVAPRSSDTNLGVFLDKLKDLKEVHRQTILAMKSESLPSNRTKMSKALDKIKSVIKSAEEVLDHSLGPEDARRYKEVKKAYREIYYPLQKSAIVKSILEHTRMNDNIAKSLRGTDKANVILRNIIKNDKEALKHVIGQQYDRMTPKKFYNKKSYLKEYKDQFPELDPYIAARDQVSNNVKKYKSNIEEQQKRHEEIQSKHKEAVAAKKSEEAEYKIAKSEYKDTESLRKKLESEHKKQEIEYNRKKSEISNLEKEKTKRETEHKEIKSKINAQKELIAKGNSKIEKMKKHIDILEKESNATKLTQSELSRIKKEIADSKRELSSLKTQVDKDKNILFRLGKEAVKMVRIIKGAARFFGKF